MATLRIKNFGAIKKADFNLNKVNLFIGYTSTGKSTAAKLLAIFNSTDVLTIPDGDFESFRQLLTEYDINFEFKEDTEIFFEQDEYFWKIGRQTLQTNNKDAELFRYSENPQIFIEQFIKQKKDNIDFADAIKQVEAYYQQDKKTNLLDHLNIASSHRIQSPIYIPAERILISTFSNSIFSLLEAGATIPQCISRFGSLYEKARKKRKETDIDILNIKVNFSKEDDSITMNDQTNISLKQASSGILSVLPLWVVLEDNSKSDSNNLILIEEPELNLYPSVQLELINWIMGKIVTTNNKIVITTHSPYILTAVDDLIMGQDAYSKHEQNNGIIEKLKTLLPTESLVNFSDVASYYFDKEGSVKNIRDVETRSVGAEYLDEASEKTSYIFNELSNLL